VTSAAWMTSELMEATDVRKLKLLCRASRTSAPDWYLVTVTEGLIGHLQPDGWDDANTMVLSFSMTKTRQEIMLLMLPFRLAAWRKRERCARRERRTVRLEYQEVVTTCGTYRE